MFTTPNRDVVQRLVASDPRVTSLHDDVRDILDRLVSLDIALRNRDYVSQRLSETDAHDAIANASAMLRMMTGV